MIQPAAPLPVLPLTPFGVACPPSAPVPEPRFAALLVQTARDAHGERIAIGALAEAFGRRGHGALLVLLGLPNALPLPVPALSLLTGLPLLMVAAQIAAGREVPWFPASLRDRALPAAELRRIALAVALRLARLDRVVRPRLTWLVTGAARRMLGLFAFVLAVALFLPLPFGNALPGLALALVGLALLERDGVAAMAAVAVGLAGLAVAGLASAAILGGLVLMLERLLG